MTQSQSAKILTELRRAKGRQVSLTRLVLVSGSYAVATRVSNLRAKKIKITNTLERNRFGGWSSYYRLEG